MLSLVYATGCFPGQPLEALDWLVTAREYFEPIGVPVMSPFTCVIKELENSSHDCLPVVLPNSVHWTAKAQTARQAAAIEESAALLVCLDGFGLNLVGTLEVMSAITIARLLGKPVMAFGLPPEHLKQSPWLSESLYSLQLSIDEALETINDFLGFQGYDDIYEEIL